MNEDFWSSDLKRHTAIGLAALANRGIGVLPVFQPAEPLEAASKQVSRPTRSTCLNPINNRTKPRWPHQSPQTPPPSKRQSRYRAPGSATNGLNKDEFSAPVLLALQVDWSSTALIPDKIYSFLKPTRLSMESFRRVTSPERLH